MSNMEKNKILEKIIKNTYSSLESHLPYTHSKLNKWQIKDKETNNFHIKCVKEYAETIYLLTKLY